jgi:DNA-binding transcriptional MerR regulator
MLDVQPAFLRRLDTEAVVQPARSDGGQRRYTRLDIHVVERVVSLADDGLTLAGIRRLLILEERVRDLQRQIDTSGPTALPSTTAGAPQRATAPTRPPPELHPGHQGQVAMTDPDEMSYDQLTAIRARLDEPPPLLALAERNRGLTALTEYLRSLQEDRVALVEEVDRLRAEMAGPPGEQA